MIVNFFVGFSSGAIVVIAQFYGANEDKKVFKAVHSAFAMSIICGILMMIFGIFFRKCLELIGVPNDIINYSRYEALFF